MDYFGEQFDIHGGGHDLRFPHHEAEIFQGECHTGCSPVVHHWLHNGFVNIDGEKMSKSKGNIIDIFLPEKQLKKQIMTIQTDSTPLDSPKDFENCNVHKIFRLIAEKGDTKIVENKYKSGGYGYGHAKMDLFELILDKYKDQRKRYSYSYS